MPTKRQRARILWIIMATGVWGLICGSFNPAFAQTQEPIDASPEAATSANSEAVALTLPDVITLLLQNNRNLKNAALDRIVQQQQLREAESAFEPRFQPSLGVNLGQTLVAPTVDITPIETPSENGQSEANISQFNSFESGGANTTETETVQVAGQLRTPLGSEITVTVSPFDNQRFNLSITQPLLRGFSRAVNQAPVQQARITESRNVLELRNTLTEQITEASIAYRALARAQETLRISQLSLANQRRQLEFIQVLVNAGRRARADIIEIQASLAATETNVLAAQNALEQAKADLLQLLDLDETLNIVIPDTLIQQFQGEGVASEATANFKIEELLQTAYANRPDYLQAQLAIESAELSQLIARDNQRWRLDLQAGTGIGDTVDVSGGVILTREFGNESLQTARTEADVTRQQNENTLASLRDSIRLEVESRLRDVNAAQAQITATQKARQLAEQRLEIASVQLRRGRGGVDVFQILSLQESLVEAQNAEVNAKIELLDAITQLEQATGTTLATWQSHIDQSQLLVNPEPQ